MRANYECRSNTAARAPVNFSSLMTDEELEPYTHDSSGRLDKYYTSRTPLASNENCDVYTAKRKSVKPPDAIHPTELAGERVVVKVVECDPYDVGRKEKLIEEIRMFATVSTHPYIVNFVECFFTPDECLTVMSFAKVIVY